MDSQVQEVLDGDALADWEDLKKSLEKSDGVGQMLLHIEGAISILAPILIGGAIAFGVVTLGTGLAAIGYVGVAAVVVLLALGVAAALVGWIHKNKLNAAIEDLFNARADALLQVNRIRLLNEFVIQLRTSLLLSTFQRYSGFVMTLPQYRQTLCHCALTLFTATYPVTYIGMSGDEQLERVGMLWELMQLMGVEEKWSMSHVHDVSVPASRALQLGETSTSNLGGVMQELAERDRIRHSYTDWDPKPRHELADMILDINPPVLWSSGSVYKNLLPDDGGRQILVESISEEPTFTLRVSHDVIGVASDKPVLGLQAVKSAQQWFHAGNSSLLQVARLTATT